MKLKTRITILFVALLGFFLFTTILNSINQQGLLNAYKENLSGINMLLSENRESVSTLDIKNIHDVLYANYEKMYVRTSINFAVSVFMILSAFVFGVYLVNRYVYKRLNRIIDFYKICRGELNTDARLVLSGNDELNMISSVLNDALDEKDEEMLKYEGKLKQERKLLLTIINRYPKNMALFRINGDFIGSNLTPLDEEEVVSIVGDNRKEIVSKSDDVKLTMKNGGNVNFSVIGPVKGVRQIIFAELD